MKKTSLKAILTLSLIATLFLFVLAGCGQNAENTSGNMGAAGESTQNSGTLILSVNPEIEITYNSEGIVTSVTACNDDALAILSAYSGFEGKECREVVTELVTEIGKAGYLVEEIEGEAQAITIEIEEGSMLPTDSFIEDIASDVKDCVSDNEWNGSVEIIGDSNYGVSDYEDTSDSNYGDSSYDDADDSNYGDSSYDDTDGSNYGDSSYDDTDDSNYGDSSYDDTDDSNYGDSSYDDTGDSNYGTTPPADTDSGYDDSDDGDSDYDNSDDGNSNYDDSDDGDSDYDDSDDGDSNYDDSDDGDSDYDDSDDGDSDYDD